MSSTILYKFRSGTTFEALSLPGSNARLLDVKKAIVTAKKLDQGSMDFDLSVKDATSGIEYMDDSAILPRGTRIVVQRLPSARGQGILAKIARSQYGSDRAPPSVQTDAGPSDSNTDFYTIDSRDREEDEEFVSSSTTTAPSTEESELAALRAATDNRISSSVGGIARTGGAMLRGGPMVGGGFRPTPIAGLGPPPPRGPGNFQPSRVNTRPNADPEIREQEQQQHQQKKRATGIPRTFLSLSAPPVADGSEGGVSGLPFIQPNTIGFEELVNRGGGQSENAAGTKRDLDYAIKLTATTIPEYLQCAICHSVVRDAMLLPWDPEGRTTCEQCIRTALTENGFRCPLTQQEGVSPDDLLPNHALRKAAAQFVNDVMEKIKEIEQQAGMEEELNVEGDGHTLLDGDLNDKGVVLTRRVTAAEKRKKVDNDIFAGDEDDFGGDVFAVEADEPIDGDIGDPMIVTENVLAEVNNTDEMEEEIIRNTNESIEKQESIVVSNLNVEEIKPEEEKSLTIPSEQAPVVTEQAFVPNETKDNTTRRDAPRRRGPPAGYTMGPAGGAVEKSSDTDNRGLRDVDRPSRRGGPPRFVGGRGFRGRRDANDGERGMGHHDNHSHSDVRILLVNRGRSSSCHARILIFHLVA
jgi:DWNN domain